MKISVFTRCFVPFLMDVAVNTKKTIPVITKHFWDCSHANEERHSQKDLELCEFIDPLARIESQTVICVLALEVEEQADENPIKLRRSCPASVLRRTI